MSEKLGKIDYGQNGPDDGGYTEAVDSGDPESFEAILSAVTHESMGDIPSSHKHENTYDGSQDEVPLNIDEPVSTKTPNAAESPFTEDNVRMVEEEGIEAANPAEIDLENASGEIPQDYMEYIKMISEANSFEDLENAEDVDVLIQKANAVADWDEELSKALLAKIESLYENAY